MKRPKIKYFLFFLILWAFGFLAWEWWNSYPKVRLVVLAPETSLEGKIDSILIQGINTFQIPGVSLALVQGGKVVYLKAFGYQNLASKEALTDSSAIPVASVSKLFTALSVANTAASLQKKATDRMVITDSTDYPKFTFRQLLEHQSGLKDQFSFRSWISRRSKLSLQDWGVDYLGKLDIDDSQVYPSTYSDLNFDLLGFWLEHKSDTYFQNQVKAEVFESGGMHDSFFLEADWMDSLETLGYKHTFLWKRLEVNKLKLQIFPSPSSGMLTTTKDMSLALVHLLRGEMGNFQEELAWLHDQENAKLLGFQKIRMLDSDWLGHFGGQAGYSSFFFFSKNDKTGIFLFFNLNDPASYRLDLSKKILTQLLQK